VIATEPRRLRRALTTAVLTVLVVPLGACTYHDTDAVYVPAQGVNARTSEVAVLNALIVSDEAGEGRFIAGIANRNQEEGVELTGVSGTGESSAVQVQLEGGDTELRPGGFLQLADPGSAQIMVSGDEVRAGTFVRLSVEFDNAAPVEVHVPVVEPGTDFTGVMSPTASPTDTESPGDGSEPTETPTAEEDTESE
jgi:hypothetical protein